MTGLSLAQVSVTDRREQYKSLAASMGAGGDEAEWCRRGGSAKDYARAALAFETIRSDVNRTNVSSSAERERMRRVLRAFALKEPRTGYCQVGGEGGVGWIPFRWRKGIVNGDGIRLLPKGDPGSRAQFCICHPVD